MSNQIKRNEIAEEGVLDNLLKPLKLLDEHLAKSDKKLKDFAQTVEKSLNFGEKSKDIREFTEAEKQLNTVYEKKKKVQSEQIKLNTTKEKLEKKLKRLRTEEAKEIAQVNEQIRVQRKKLRDQAKGLRGTGKAYDKLVKSTRNAKNESKELGAQLLRLEKDGKKNTKEYMRLSKQYADTTNKATRLDKQLKGLDKTVGDNFRNVGNYESATRKLTSAIGKLGLAFGIGTIVKNVTGTIGGFNKAQTDLQALSGKSAEELAPLTKQAKELGATSQFSATQITELQIELSKLGFTAQQISDSTGGIANFAAATGVEIPRAAALAGSALRAFNLEASEIDRVVSTLGVATTKTALDFSKLEAGLSNVAPVAASFGFSIEDTTALLGQLANAGFDASSASTATRNILLNLADANGDLAQSLGRPIKSAGDLADGLKELQEQGVDLGEALELTDKRSVAAFQTFLQGSDSLVDLSDSITDVNDELGEMADKRLDSVDGALKLLSSAWEGFILDLNEGIGASDSFQKIIRLLADNLTNIISVLGKLVFGFLAYKGILIAVNIQQKIAKKGVINLAKGFFTLGKNAKTAGSNVSRMGRALKGIGWSALIAAAIELAVSFYDVASGTRALRLEQEALKKGKEESLEFTSKVIEGERKAHNERMRLLDQEIRKRKAKGEDEDKLNEERLKREEEIKTASTKRLQDTADTQAKELNKLSELHKFLEKNDIAVLLRKNQNELTSIQKQRLDEYTSLISEVNKFSDVLEGVSIGEIARSKEVQNEILREKTLRGENLKTFLDETNKFKKEISELKTQEAELAGERENNRDKINAQVKGLKELNKERKKQILTLKEIDKILSEGETLEEIEDKEVSQITDAIEKDLSRRLTLINDAEREQSLTEKEAREQRLIAEVESLNAKKRALELYGKDVTDIDKEISEKRLEISKLFNKELNDEIVNSTEDTLREVVNGLDKFFQDFTARQQTELQQQERNAAQLYGTLEKFAAEGNLQAEESLTEMLELQQQAQREQIRLQQRQQRIEQARQVYSIIQSQLDAGKSPGEAIASTGGYMTAIQGLISSLPSFYEGTEDTGKVGKALDNKGGRLSILHDNERVIPKHINAELNDIPNQMLPYLVSKGLDHAGNSYDVMLLEEIQRTRTAIENMPNTDYEVRKVLGEFAGLLATTKKGNSKTKNLYN